MGRHKITVWVLMLFVWLFLSPAGAATFQDIGKLPASFQGELPGAGNPILWHLDLFPEGRYQLRLTHVGRPEPNRFDDIGRWVEDSSGRIVLRGGRNAPIFLMPEAGGAALRKLDTLGRPIHSSHNDRLVRLPEFRPIEPQIRLTGMFTYLADAAVITLCADGRQLPVAMEKDYIALERAYLQANISPGQPVLVCVDGMVTQRPSMEESQPPRPTLVVERFIDVRLHETCGSLTADLSLCGPRWNLVQLGDTSMSESTTPRQAYLVFDADTLHVAGSGGCNRVSGRFEIDGELLRFGPMASTRMACPDGMGLERQFLKALAQVERYRICGRLLDFLNDMGTVIVRFEAESR
ncbi:MAG: META domain-containing protein [Desulfotignum sp.]